MPRSSLKVELLSCVSGGRRDGVMQVQGDEIVVDHRQGDVY